MAVPGSSTKSVFPRATAWQTWIQVRLSGDAKRPLHLWWRRDDVLKEALKADFGNENPGLRFDWDTKRWLLKASMFAALCAAYGERLEVHPSVWEFMYPAKVRKAVRA